MFELQTKSLNLADCLDILIELYRSGKREFIDLIYIDPPFNSDKNYNIPFEGGELSEKAFVDTWSRVAYHDQLDMISKISPDLYKFLVSLEKTSIKRSYITYLTVMGIRVFFMREMLKPTGTFYYHCDPTASHYIKMILDQIFGMDNFRNEIVWCYTRPSNIQKNFPRKHDVILRYSKTNIFTFNFNSVRIPYKGLAAQGPSRRWHDDEEERIKESLEKGKIVEDYWTDITLAIRSTIENLGYPTQKPEKLLERIILASSNPGDLVADFYLGGGTTIAVAEKLDRQWIGVDINPRAIEISEQRVKDLGKQLKKDFIVSGIPKSSKELRKLIEDNVYGKDKNSKFALEDIVCKYYLKNVVGNEKKVGDDSIDGRFTFDFKNEKHSGIVQVTTSGNKTHLKNSCAVMDLEGHSMLVYVTFEDKITDPLIDLAKRYKKIGGVDRVQLLSLEDLIDKGKQFDLPKDENTILGFDIPNIK